MWLYFHRLQNQWATGHPIHDVLLFPTDLQNSLFATTMLINDIAALIATNALSLCSYGP